LFRKISEYAPQVVKEDVNAELAAEVKPMEEEGEDKGLEWEAPEEEEK
jgi:hypothetical protein